MRVLDGFDDDRVYLDPSAELPLYMDCVETALNLSQVPTYFLSLSTELPLYMDCVETFSLFSIRSIYLFPIFFFFSLPLPCLTYHTVSPSLPLFFLYYAHVREKLVIHYLTHRYCKNALHSFLSYLWSRKFPDWVSYETFMFHQS